MDAAQPFGVTMPKSPTHPVVDKYFKHVKTWREEMLALREILLDCPGLTEELKWKQPCYTFEGHNVAIIGGFKAYCALMFFKGALLKDPKKILTSPGESSQSARRIEFTSVDQIKTLKPVIKAYIKEAIAVEKAGLTVDFKKRPEPMPEELNVKLKENPALKTAFDALTPGRQRAYILHFSGAKQAKTRAARVEKCIPRILKGKGLND